MVTDVAMVTLSLGFFVGKEGPMIHIGAIIGAGIPQFRSMVCKCLKLPYSYFRSDRYFTSPSILTCSQLHPLPHITPPHIPLHPHTLHSFAVGIKEILYQVELRQEWQVC